MFKLIFIFLLIALTGCVQSELSDDEMFRINYLYEHTIIMIDFATPTQLEHVNLDKSHIQNRLGISYEEKVKQLELAFGLDLEEYTINEKIYFLEITMDKMMENWYFE